MFVPLSFTVITLSKGRVGRGVVEFKAFESGIKFLMGKIDLKQLSYK